MLKSKINIRLESFAVLGPLLGGIAGLLLTVAVFLVSRETELKRFHLEFQADASMRARLVEDGLRERFQEVRIIARTMGRKGCFDEGGFRSLGVSLGLDSRGMVGMAWLPVEDPGRAGTIGTRVPREALERALQAGDAVVSPRIALPGEEQGYGFFILGPVFDADSPSADLAARRKSLRGFVAAFFRAQGVVHSALERTAPVGLPFDLLDLSASPDQRLVYRWVARLRGEPPWPFPVYPAPPSLLGGFPFGGRKWGVEVTAGGAYIDRRFSPLHWLFLPLGLALTGYFSLSLRRALSAQVKMEMDVTERTARLAESEDRFRTIFDTVEEAIFVRDPGSGTILHANRRTGEMFGYPAEEIARLRVGDLSDGHPPWSEDEIRQLIRKAREEGPQSFEWKAKDRAGRRFWTEIDLRHFDMGGSDHLLFVVRDVDRRRQMEEEVFHARRLESLSALAGGVGHDINNLLTAVTGNIALAEMQLGDPPQAKEKLADAEGAALRIKELVERMMDFTREAQLERVPLRIEGLLREAVDESLGEGPARAKWELEPGLWDVEADEKLLRQALVYVLDNASEAMPGGGEVEISADNLAVTTDDPPLPMRKGEFVRIIIRDHGVGIARKDLSRIFDLYFTTKNDPTIRGIGLSLPLTYSIVKRHGGFITVQSQVGEGTTFTICLPRLEKKPA